MLKEGLWDKLLKEKVVVLLMYEVKGTYHEGLWDKPLR